MKRILLSLLLAVFLVSGCAPLGNSQLNSARARWNAAHVAHYRFDLHVGCFCAFMDKMPLTIEVNGGNPVSMLYKDGTPVSTQDQQMFARYDTIARLFDFTTESIKNADDIKVEYDATYGFPSSVQIDFVKNATDDELTLAVNNFQALP